MDYCREILVEPEALQERGRLIEQVKTLQAANPSWFTLRSSYADGRAWRQYLKDNLPIEDYAFEALGEVGGFENLGQFEVNRIISHLLKDSTSQRQADRHSPSRWLMRSCNESLQAMADWQSWDSMEQRNKGLEFTHGGG